MLAKVTGAPIFGVDVDLARHALRHGQDEPALLGEAGQGPIISKAEKMPGVVKIVPIDTTYGSGFGVIAENTWAAFNAADAIEVEWGAAEYPADSAGDLQGAAGRVRRSRVRRCATTAMSKRPSPMRRATGSSKPNTPCPSSRMPAWSR